MHVTRFAVGYTLCVTGWCSALLWFCVVVWFSMVMCVVMWFTVRMSVVMFVVIMGVVVWFAVIVWSCVIKCVSARSG